MIILRSDVETPQWFVLFHRDNFFFLPIMTDQLRTGGR